MTEKPREATLHPADVFRAQPGAAPTGGEFEVVRTPRTRCRAMAGWAALAAVLCLVPAVIVWFRAEPGYLVRAAWIVAIVAAILAAGILLTVAWFVPVARSGQVLNLTDDSIAVGPASGSQPAELAWRDVRRCQIVGRYLPSLVLTVVEPTAPDTADGSEESNADDDEPQPVEFSAPPVDFENDPPPPFVMPPPEAFEGLKEVTDGTEQNDGAERTDNAAEPSDTSSADDTADEATEAEEAEAGPGRGELWNERFYGTRYVIPLWGTAPPRPALEDAIYAYSERRFGRASATRK